MTLKEIAKEANVSISTVSRVINNKGKSVASKEVQDRIWDIVRKTNYVPNSAAQSLRSGHEQTRHGADGTIECFFGRTLFYSKDQFFSELARAVEVEALGLNYVLRYSYTPLALQDETTRRSLANSDACGLVILGRCDKAITQLLRKHFKNVCYVGLNYSQPECDQVICDGREASKAAVEHLIGLGHKRIGYIGEARDEIRYIGYRDAMIDGKMPTDSSLVSNALLSYDGGYNGAKKLLTAAPDITAVFCANDITAVGAMRAFQESGLSIPKDISVIGVDNIETAKYLTPPLTTIHIPIEEMGQHATKLLVDRINKGHKTPVRLMLPYHLEVRESCGPPRKK